MAKRLAKIPRCSKCGNEVFSTSGILCRSCQMKQTRESYRQTVDAENKMRGADSWMHSYSPWKNIIIIPVTIALLILVVIAIFIISN